MLHEIHIQNYAVIDDLTVEFHRRLNLLSGETGSGKSIVVDALGLALGGRATADVIRTGCERATVTAVFRSPMHLALKRWLEELGLEETDEAEIILRRVIHSNGRSRLLVKAPLIRRSLPADFAAARIAAPVSRPSRPTVIGLAWMPLRSKCARSCSAEGPGTAEPPATVSTVT